MPGRRTSSIQRRPAPHYRHLKVSQRRVDQEEPWPHGSPGHTQPGRGKCRLPEESRKSYTRIESTGVLATRIYRTRTVVTRVGDTGEVVTRVCNSCIERANVCKPGVEARKHGWAGVGEARITVACVEEPGVAGARGVTVPPTRVAGTEVPEARVGTCLGERAAKTGVDVAAIETTGVDISTVKETGVDVTCVRETGVQSPALKKPVFPAPEFPKPVF